MQRIYLIILSLLPYMLTAQHRLESHLNMFRTYDILVKQQVEYKDPGRSGENVLWDFGNLSVVNGAYELAYRPGLNGAVNGTEHATRYNYRLSGDSLLLWGFRNQSTQLRNRQPELLLKFPVHYGDTVQSHFYAHGKHGNLLEMDAMGTTVTIADAYGMMILPNKDTLKHTLRTRTLKYIARDTKSISPEYVRKDTVQFVIPTDSIDYRLAADSVIFAVETFRWYEKGYRYPVFETVRSWEQHPGSIINYENTAFFYPPQDHYYLNDDEDNLSLLNDTVDIDTNDPSNNPWAGLNYNFYPNPVETSLEIEIYLPKPANSVSMKLTDKLGRSVWEEHYGNWPQGFNTVQIFMVPFVKGEYVLNMWFEGYMLGEKILKK